MKRTLPLLLAVSAACGSTEASVSIKERQQIFSDAVSAVAVDGGEPFALDDRVPCDFDLLVGEYSVRMILGEEPDYAAAIVANSDGEVPEFGLVQCFENDAGKRIVRGNDGW